jgi:hypothetical protein
MRLHLHLTAVALAVVGVACPFSAFAGPVRIGEQTGLGLLGPEVPDVLKQAKAAPYAMPAGPVCESAVAELDALNQVLGPDAHEPQLKSNQAAKLVTKAIRGLIPHKDVLRFVTGAGRKEGALQQAAMAGWARRGFLRGLTQGCGQDTQVAAAQAPTVETPPLAPSAENAAIPVSTTAPDIHPAPLEPEETSAQPRIQTVDSAEPVVAAVNP